MTRRISVTVTRPAGISVGTDYVPIVYDDVEYGEGPPSDDPPAEPGQLYLDTLTGILYEWEE